MDNRLEKQKETKSDAEQPKFDALALHNDYAKTVKGASYAAKPADLNLNPAEISRIDPKKPTVAFLDGFEHPKPQHFNAMVDSRPGLVELPVGHGEVSARAAEQNGFNVVRIDDKELAPALAGIEKDVANGKLPLGKGDVLNISLGQERAWGAMTYPEASQKFGMDINKNNLGDPKVQKEMRHKMEALAKKPGKSEDSEFARNALSILDSVDRLQKQGIQVMHAQPNNVDKFDAEFINGKMELSAKGTDGKMANFSADNTLSKASLGVFEVQHQSYDIMKNTPISGHRLITPDEGSYSIKAGDRTVNLGPGSDRVQYSPTRISPSGEVSKLEPDNKTLMAPPATQPELFQGKASAGGTRGAYKFDGSTLPPLKIVHTRPAATDHLTDTTFGSLRGTSFVNIIALEAEKEKLTAEKANR